jgi:DNA-binding MarR family transcriptional regulator
MMVETKMRGVTENELVSSWRDLLGRYHATWCALDRELREGHGLGASEFEVLDQLTESCCDKQALRMQELGKSVQLSQSALSRVVARLEADGLVTRALCADDRRGIYVELTEDGRARHAAAAPTHRSVLAANLS